MLISVCIKAADTIMPDVVNAPWHQGTLGLIMTVKVGQPTPQPCG
ncbi:hypothetical protein ABXT60_11020 [Candidatus Njordibacter sp. Uisw_056]